MASSTEMSRNKILSGAGSPRSGSLHHPTSSPARNECRRQDRDTSHISDLHTTQAECGLPQQLFIGHSILRAFYSLCDRGRVTVRVKERVCCERACSLRRMRLAAKPSEPHHQSGTAELGGTLFLPRPFPDGFKSSLTWGGGQ